MVFTPEVIQSILARILPKVEKPGRYTGGEFNQVVKDWDGVKTHLALAFPDIYDIGMSNLGWFILYESLNQRPDVLAERAFSPWSDMETAMRQAKLPLYSLESKHSLNDFDIIGFSLPYETLYTNTLNLLDLAGIPLLTAERTTDHPLIIAGGHATYNPEPMHAFFDAFVIGEGEEVIHDVVNTHQAWRARNGSRWDLWISLAQISGVYVPSLYQVEYAADGTVASIHPRVKEAPAQVLKRIVGKLPPPPTHLIVPYIDVVQNRIPIEIMRGCTRGCRFCHAGMINRPVRERTVDEILYAIDQALSSTGYEEIGLLSLSSSDYTHILDLVNAISQRYSGKHLSISLPSLRIESFSVDLMDALKDARRSGFTLAPEAATERMRQIINKPLQTEQLLDTAQAIFSRGWSNLKLYFMIGHPSETTQDVQAIAELCRAVLAVGRRAAGKRAQVTAGVSTFIPKPHTPFQWVACDTLQQIQDKQALLKRELRGPGLKLNWNSPQDTMLEAWLSRGDRRMAQVILQAWRRGARFDAWSDQYKYGTWMEAFSETGLDPAFYTHRARQLDEVFPWDHIRTGVRKKYLIQEYQASQDGKTRPDCRQGCFACGILPAFADLRRSNPGDAWRCPDMRPRPTSLASSVQSPTSITRKT